MALASKLKYGLGLKAKIWPWPQSKNMALASKHKYCLGPKA